MSRHYKTHCSTEYTKEQYKADVLARNGRPLNNCEVCDEIVPIPKGEAEAPRFHKACYTSNLSGAKNPNYKNAKAKKSAKPAPDKTKLSFPIVPQHSVSHIYILCGPSGAGKTWLANQLTNHFNIIDMDRLKFDECIKIASTAQERSLVVINTQATRFARELAEKGIRCSVAVINEHEDVIKHRLSMRGGEFTKGVAKRIKRYQTLAVKLAQFAGTQSEVLSWLKSQS
jgi:hypothetical protein